MIGYTIMQPNILRHNVYNDMGITLSFIYLKLDSKPSSMNYYKLHIERIQLLGLCHNFVKVDV